MPIALLNKLLQEPLVEIVACRIVNKSFPGLLLLTCLILKYNIIVPSVNNQPKMSANQSVSFCRPRPRVNAPSFHRH